jgi:SnoaL-like polyketide cyclase
MRITLVLASVLLTMLPAQGQEQATKQAETNKAAVRGAVQVREQGDLKTLNEIFDPKGPVHTPRGKIILQSGPFTDLKSSCPMCASLRNRQITTDLRLSNGDLVAVGSAWSGKYSATFRGTAAADKDVSIVYTNIYRIAEGKIAENWYQADGHSLVEQLGMKLTPADASK